MDHAIHSAYELKTSLDRYWRGSLVRSVCLFCLIVTKKKSFNSTISLIGVLIGFKCYNQGHFPPSEGHDLCLSPWCTTRGRHFWQILEFLSYLYTGYTMNNFLLLKIVPLK